MKNIVNTIQQEQNAIIRDVKHKNLIVQGIAGSGKTRVALHRIAFLLYKIRNLKSSDVLILSPNNVFSDKESNNKESVELRNIFRNESKDYIISKFDEFYLKILDYFKDRNKIIVIDSAQYRNIKDYSILKGKVIVMRTSIQTCYERVLNRFKENKKQSTIEEYQAFEKRKKGMFNWYKSLNEFIKKVDNINTNI